MIKACQNLSCLSHRADPCYLWLHAQTQWEQHYYIKHAYGISTNFNRHSKNDPWYGAGQGMGDEAIRWVTLSDSMIKGYQSQDNQWKVYSPMRERPNYTLSIDAFMDEILNIHGQHDTQDLSRLIPVVQRNLDHGQGILRACGSALNLSKCTWIPITLALWC